MVEREQVKMKKIGIQISICMGLALSLCLSLIGNISSGNFTFALFGITFLASAAISLLFAFIIPMGRISRFIAKGSAPHSLKPHFIDAFVSDLIYTPVITFAMILLVRKLVPEEALSQMPPFAPMFFRSLLINFIAGFVLILILQPIFKKLVLKGHGIH